MVRPSPRPSNTPLHYRRPSKCPCVIQLFPPLQNTALTSPQPFSFPHSYVICSIPYRQRIFPGLQLLLLLDLRTVLELYVTDYDSRRVFTDETVIY